MAKATRQQIIQFRKTVNKIAGFVGLGIFFYKVKNEVFPQGLINDGNPKPVPEQYYKLLHDVAAKVQLDNPEKIRLFISRSPSSTRAGAPYLPNGGAIGLPDSASFLSQNDIKENITFKGQQINWESKGGKILLENLQLNEANISFILANELYRMKTFDYAINVIAAPCWFFGSIELLKHCIQRLAKKNRLPKEAPFVTVVGIVSSLSLFMYVVFNNLFNTWCEKKADESAAKCDPVFLNGGMEYIVKRMRVNQVFKALMEDDEEKRFSKTGNDKRFDVLPLSVRLGYLDDISKLQLHKYELKSEIFKSDSN